MANTNKSVAVGLAWIHVILTLMVAGHFGDTAKQGQITGGAGNHKDYMYLYVSILAYIIVAIFASKAASDEELDDQDKSNNCPSNKGVQMYRAAMVLAIIVIVYHVFRLVAHKKGSQKVGTQV